MADTTFVVHKEWLENIQGLPKDQQDKIISEFVRYGVGLPLMYENDPTIQAFVNMLKGRIDYSKDKYNQKVNMGKATGQKKKIQNIEILRLAREGRTSTEIAKILGCSKSTVDHSDGWKRRFESSNENESEDETFIF